MSYVQPNKRWTSERRERAANFHRKRHGAPDGFSTVHGVHVPSEHEKPVRFWADWLKHNHGPDTAAQFINELKADNWSRVPGVRALWLRRKQIHENKELIRRLQWEAHRANPNCG